MIRHSEQDCFGDVIFLLLELQAKLFLNNSDGDVLSGDTTLDAYFLLRDALLLRLGHLGIILLLVFAQIDVQRGPPIRGVNIEDASFPV